MDWLTTFIGGAGTAAVFLILAAYARIKQIKTKANEDAVRLRQQADAALAAKEKSDLDIERLRNEMSTKKRKDDDDFNAAKEERLQKRWEDYTEELKSYFLSELKVMRETQNSMKLESDKRRDDHVRCQAESDFLRKQVDELRSENVEMKSRIAHLEGKP